MKTFKSVSKRILKNNKGQGMVEYILILVVVVALVSVAKKPLMDLVTGKLIPGVTGAVDTVLSP